MLNNDQQTKCSFMFCVLQKKKHYCTSLLETLRPRTEKKKKTIQEFFGGVEIGVQPEKVDPETGKWNSFLIIAFNHLIKLNYNGMHTNKKC